MSNRVTVSSSQVTAAKLKIKRAEAAGSDVPPAIKAIADAVPADAVRSADPADVRPHGQRTD